MKLWIVILVIAALVGGAIGYATYAKACQANGGKCCGECPPEKK